MSRMIRVLSIILLLTGSVFSAPNIVVSIAPIRALVSDLTQGVTAPKLLLKKTQSAHHSHLQPSQLTLLTQTDLIISVHPHFETSLAKALKNIDANKKITLNNDKTGNRHSWLDIASMKNLSHKIVKKLSQIDPNNRAIYQKNLTLTYKKLTQLEQQTQKKLAPYRNAEIAIFSTALMPFLNANQLKKPIVITHAHGDKLSIYKIRNAIKAMHGQQSQCLLSTIEIPKKRINALIEGLDINTASIDIMGFNQTYFQLINTISKQIAQCLK